MSETIQSELFLENKESFRRIIHIVPSEAKNVSIWADHRSDQESDDPYQGKTGTFGQTIVWINHDEVANDIQHEFGTYQYRFDKSYGQTFNGKKIEIKVKASNLRSVLKAA
jgi:hypothetical protein